MRAADGGDGGGTTGSAETLARDGYCDGAGQVCGGAERAWARVECLYRAIRAHGGGDDRWLSYALGFVLGRRDVGLLDNGEYGQMVGFLAARAQAGVWTTATAEEQD